MTDDGALVQRAKAGDSRAFADLLAPHENALRAAVRPYLRNREDVAEAVQGAKIKAWFGLNTFRGDSSFATWLCSIGRREALDMVRAAKRRPEYRAELPELADTDSTPHSIAEALETLERRLKSSQDASAEGEIITVPLSAPGGDLVAAYMFLAALAYPESIASRKRALLAMHALMVRVCRDAGRALPVDASDTMKRMPTHPMRNTLGRLEDRLGKRLLAAEHASLLLMRVRRGGKALRPSDFAAEYKSGHSFYMREVWAPEVLHLGLALHSLRLQWTDPRGFGIFTLLANPQWVRRAIDSAETNAEHLPIARNLPPALRGLRAGRFIRLVPA